MGDGALVGIVMGSKSDEPFVEETKKILDDLGVPYESSVMSAHRAPERVMQYARDAQNRGIKVLIGAAGGAAALPGVLASWTTIPVIGIPLPTSDLKGIDALYAICQMPPGIPVACVAIGSWGARNAGYLAASILGISNAEVQSKYEEYREKLRSS